MRRITLAVAIGALTTLLLMGLAFALSLYGYDALSRVLFWQNYMLQSLVPAVNVGTSLHPIYEGSPLNLIALAASIPLGIAIYGVVAFVLMGRFSRT
jgi:hypothetical protein